MRCEIRGTNLGGGRKDAEVNMNKYNNVINPIILFTKNNIKRIICFLLKGWVK